MFEVRSISYYAQTLINFWIYLPFRKAKEMIWFPSIPNSALKGIRRKVETKCQVELIQFQTLCLSCSCAFSCLESAEGEVVEICLLASIHVFQWHLDKHNDRSNSAFLLLLSFLGRYGGCVTSMSIPLPRFKGGIKVTPIWACLEPSIRPASWCKTIGADAVSALSIHVSSKVVEPDSSSILAHKVRLWLAGVRAPWNTSTGAPNPNVLFNWVISHTFALKHTENSTVTFYQDTSLAN